MEFNDKTWNRMDYQLNRVPHQLNRILQAEHLLPGSDDPLSLRSALHQEVIYPWQPGFFPDEKESDAAQPMLHIPATASSRQQLEAVQHMFNTGTTTLGFIYPQGIILATDSRATANGLIVTQKLNKVIPVSSRILCTLAGNAADCVYWLRSLKKECEAYERKYGVPMSVRHAANLLVNMVRKYRSSNIVSKSQAGLSFGTLMACYDQQLGPQLYMLDNTGLLLDGTVFCVGSGAEHAQAILDTEYRPDLSEAQARELATSAIYYACRRDIHSGGYVRLYKIDREGWREVFCRDVNDIYNDMNQHNVAGGDRR